MPKNDKLINSLKEIAARNRAENIRVASERDTPEIYAALAIALWRSMNTTDDFKREFINSVFCLSQEIWAENYEKNMAAMCYEETGIQLQNN